MISFIVGTRNRPEELKRFIDHLWEQTSSDYEIVVADEGDNAWVRGYVSKYYWQPWAEDWHYSAKNQAAHLASGDYLAFPQDDAVYHVDFVRLMQRGVMSICGWVGAGGSKEPNPTICEVDVGGFTIRKKEFTETLFKPGASADGALVEIFLGRVVLVPEVLYEKR